MNSDCFTVRAVLEKGRIRLRSESMPRHYVQAPRAWRQSIERGALVTIRAHVRRDSKCLVMLPLR